MPTSTSDISRRIPIRVVLVRSLYETNVGSVSRVMSNMGADQLILVDRKCSLTFKSQQSAATGQAGLQGRIEVPSMKEYLELSPGTLKIAFTARDGRARQVRPFAEALTGIPGLLEGRYPAEAPNAIDLIFGPEDAGLSCEEVDAAHMACSLKTFGRNTSLNLSHAVLVAIYLLQDHLAGAADQLLHAPTSPAEKEHPDDAFAFPEEALKTWLWETGFDVVDRPINAFTILKRWLLRGLPTSKENRILETVLRQGVRKMQEYNSSRRERGLPAGFAKRAPTQLSGDLNETSDH